MKHPKIALLLGLGLGLTASLSLSGCAAITGIGKDNTPAPSPLVNFQPQLHPHQVWSSRAGKGTDEQYLNLVPAINGNAVFTADYKGNVTALDLQSGKKLWQTDLDTPLVAGPGVGQGVVLVGNSQAGLIALNQSNGKALWHTTLSNQIIAPPVIADNMAMIKTLDGQFWAINLSNGSTLWRRGHNVPFMRLSGGSRPKVVGDKVIVGYADGKLDAYSLQGKLLWQIAAANPQGASDVEQMVDIVADPKISGNTIYVVTYQGNLTAVNTDTGNVIWQQPLSSYSGLALSNQAVFVTDATGTVKAYNRSNGQLLWQQDNLKYRKLTAPVVVGNSIVVGDGEGYLQFLSQSDGSVIGRETLDKNTPIMTAPIVNGNNIYVLDSDGLLADYSL